MSKNPRHSGQKQPGWIRLTLGMIALKLFAWLLKNKCSFVSLPQQDKKDMQPKPNFQQPLKLPEEMMVNPYASIIWPYLNEEQKQRNIIFAIEREEIPYGKTFLINGPQYWWDL